MFWETNNATKNKEINSCLLKNFFILPGFLQHLLCDKCDGFAWSAGSCCPPHSMDVIFGMCRDVKVDYYIYMWDIQSSVKNKIPQYLKTRYNGMCWDVKDDYYIY